MTSDGARGGRFVSAVDLTQQLGLPRPTEEQIAVIEAPLEATLVVAGAGSGKTETMAQRVVWLVANHLAEPDEILGLTFTRKAAGELGERIQQRLARLTAQSDARDHSVVDLLARPATPTYNSFAASLVRDFGLRAGIDPDAVLLTEAGSWQLAAQIVEAWGDDVTSDVVPSSVVAAVLSLAGQMSEHLVEPQALRTFAAELVEQINTLPFGGRRRKVPDAVQALCDRLTDRGALADLVTQYQAAKRERGLLDYADQLALAGQLVQADPGVCTAIRGMYRVVILDEYQDTSYAQNVLLATLFGSGHAVMAVGDPNQAIYGWRGASASGLSGFPDSFRRADGTPATVLTLSTAWRNDHAILDAANHIAAPLRATLKTTVKELTARPAAGTGEVLAHWALSSRSEAQRVAEFIASRWRAPQGGQAGVTAAVLCRKRSQFPALEEALRARGIPVEVVGLGGLLSSPEVADLVAFLTVVHDPARGDALARLLTGPWLNIGLADLHALARWARHLDRDGALPNGQGPDTVQALAVELTDEAEARSLADAVDLLATAEGRRHALAAGVSHTAVDRLMLLAEQLASGRRTSDQSLADQVSAAEHLLGLDAEVALSSNHQRGRANLDAFNRVAREFVDGNSPGALGAFLDWLTAAEKRERGLDTPVANPDPAAVQIITIHGAKGLEWDVCAIPGMVDGSFPDPKSGRDTTAWAPGAPSRPAADAEDGASAQSHGTGEATDSAWLNNMGELPYPLRGDRGDLPALTVAGAETMAEVSDRIDTFRAAAGSHAVAEERRLAYVAVTRARRSVLLSGSWWRGSNKTLGSPSVFLAELISAGLVSWDAASVPESDRGEENPEIASVDVGWWPAVGSPSEAHDVRVAAAERIHAAAARVQDASALRSEPADLGANPTTPDEWEAVAQALAAVRYDTSSAATPRADHVAASAVAKIASDPQGYLAQLRRPIPEEPSQAATIGTQVHARIQAYFEMPTLDVMPDGGALTDPEAVERLWRTFLTTPWAQRQPVAVEVPIDTVVAGTTVRARLDAVFPDPENPGGHIVVDWKTGRPPEPGSPEAHARATQLSIYRLAWAQHRHIDPALVDAAFVYLADGSTVRPDVRHTESDLERMLAPVTQVGNGGTE